HEHGTRADLDQPALLCLRIYAAVRCDRSFGPGRNLRLLLCLRSRARHPARASHRVEESRSVSARFSHREAPSRGAVESRHREAPSRAAIAKSANAVRGSALVESTEATASAAFGGNAKVRRASFARVRTQATASAAF